MSANDTCPTWCQRSGPAECGGDHWASPGDGDWLDIEATGYQPQDAREFVSAAPTWGEVDGLAPAVQVLFRRVSLENVAIAEETFDLTPEEAEALANQILRAAAAARATTKETT